MQIEATGAPSQMKKTYFRSHATQTPKKTTSINHVLGFAMKLLIVD
jgi:hypothetical protein